MRLLLAVCATLVVTPTFSCAQNTTPMKTEESNKAEKAEGAAKAGTASPASNAALHAPELQASLPYRHQDSLRRFQGIPGIECAPNGRLWATWYTGGTGEGPENLVVLTSSDDDGKSWSAPNLVVDPPGAVRAFDPVLWLDPQKRLWLFWGQSNGHWDGRGGVWYTITENPDESTPAWSAPRRICDGIMLNKPTVLSSGEWLLPVAVWSHMEPLHPDVAPELRTSHVAVSTDAGKTWKRRGGADVPERTFDEHMIVERRDGSLWMLVRLRDGIGESISPDKGHTWSPGRKTELTQPNSRFFIRRLESGKLLLVKHHNYLKQGDRRNNLMALLSTDDGKTWQGGLLLDERKNVSYPDGTQAADGRIYVVYDRGRYLDKEILMAVFTEEDVLAGKPVSAGARLQVLVNQAGRPKTKPS